MATILDLAFMVFALGFFIYSMRIVTRDHREAWEQRMMEAREFAYRDQSQENDQTLHEK